LAILRVFLFAIPGLSVIQSFAPYAIKDSMNEGEVSYWPRRVHYGAGSLSRLASIVKSLGGNRVMVICGQTVASGAMLEKVRSALGEHYVGAFTDVRAQTPLPELSRAASEVRAHGADTLVSVGGGSAIDAAKGVVLYSATNGDLLPYSIQYAAKGMERRRLGTSPFLHIAVPTTAGSGSDVMPTAGIRDPQQGKKILFWDDRLVPDATILDPEMAVHAGARLTAASGMTAVARSIEALYSKHRNPMSTGLALHSARLLLKWLPVAVNHPGDLEARQNCQMACAMASTASLNAMASLVHPLGHIFGGRYGLQHGIAHAILLPPSIRRLLPCIGTDYNDVMDALGCPKASSSQEAADLACGALSALLHSLPLPQSLKDVGVKHEELASIASAASREYMLSSLPIALTPADIERVLQEAW
jgi:alcohol dehydrogenase class IV